MADRAERRVLLGGVPDERLVTLARAGDEQAFATIVERYRAPLLRYCHRFLPPAAAEDALQQTFINAYHVNHGLETVALRFFTVYGPRQRPDMAFRRFCEAAAHGGAIELFDDGRQSRDFTYVGDVVGAIRSAGTAEGAAGRAYNVGGGSPISLNGALEQLAAISGRPLDVARSERESGDVLHTAADVGRARAELGFVPATNLADGLRAEYEWVLARAPRRPRLAAVAAATPSAS